MFHRIIYRVGGFGEYEAASRKKKTPIVYELYWGEKDSESIFINIIEKI